jgi:hypothetical protein
MDSIVVKFPYEASRRLYSRRPRKSINGTPEERAAKAAQEITAPADIAFIGKAKPDLWCEAGVVLSKLNCKGLLPEAVKCLQRLLTIRMSVSAAITRQRPASYAMPADELVEKIHQLTENDQQYMSGYIQGLVDGRAT